ncbi:chalcone isomerase family protein [Desulfosediminicola ganghwensis]|uniref:chalcone isomerase family protein n=1 Tax=Desulfosediminicola ganghwensis TaxID=2569540 RepID=UPI0010AC68EC|nr:chalcone isomerase family protein [Desulfosediminicola ganghwensis]
MKKIYLFILTIVMSTLPLSLQGMEIHNMQLQGSGSVRYMGFIKVYDAHLYTDPTTLPGEVLSPESSRCLKLNYAVSLTRENFIEAAEKILNRQHDPLTISKVRPQLDLLHQNYTEVDDGDSYVLCYNGEAQTTRLFRNGIEQVVIPSADFAAVYFGIWLGEKEPLSDNLRANLLSGLRGKKS